MKKRGREGGRKRKIIKLGSNQISIQLNPDNFSLYLSSGSYKAAWGQKIFGVLASSLLKSKK